MSNSKKFTKKILEKFIIHQNKTYREIGRYFNCTDLTVKRKAISFGIKLPVRKVLPEGYAPHNKNKRYSKNKMDENVHKCSVCGKGTRNRHFCSNKCQAKKTSEDKWVYYLNNQKECCKVNFNCKTIKPYILREQNSKCKICQMPNSWNGKNLVFVLDHIDGNAANNLRKNLRLICPNCDSQLPTFKSKNKNSARINRYPSRKNIN